MKLSKPVKLSRPVRPLMTIQHHWQPLATTAHHVRYIPPPASPYPPMTVHLLKNRSDDAELGRPDPYEEHIPDYRFVPIMDYENIGLAELAHELATPFDGIVITSQRAVDSLKIVLAELDAADRATVLAKPVYTVGPTTAARLRTLQFRQVHGADSGNGVALAREMLAGGVKPHSRLLFVAGEVHRRQLPDALAAAGHAVTTLVVYRTVGNPNITDALDQLVEDNDWIVFFAPSHTQPVLNFLRHTNKRVRLASIGPTTQQFLHDEGFAVAATAAKPSAEALRDAIAAA